jgi:hypothetical protein
MIQCNCADDIIDTGTLLINNSHKLHFSLFNICDQIKNKNIIIHPQNSYKI